MYRIVPSFITYSSSFQFSQLRHVKKLTQVSMSGSSRTKAFKKSLNSIQNFKCQNVAIFKNADAITPRALSRIAQVLKNSHKCITKITFQSTSFCYSSKAKLIALKQILKKLHSLETLSVICFELNCLKFCRGLKNIKISIPEDSKTSAYLFSQMKRLPELKHVEICVPDQDAALSKLKDVYCWKSLKQCLLDVIILKTIYSFDNIETVGQTTLKKVAAIELDLARLPSFRAGSIDPVKLEAHLQFLKFLLEPVGKIPRRRRLFECVKFPGMKLQLDPKEYDTPMKVYSLLDCFLSVYASSVVHVKEYSHENHLAKFSFELSTLASSRDLIQLLKDVVEVKDIKYLHLELEVKSMTKTEFDRIIEEICKINGLEFLYVVSGTFCIEIKYPLENCTAGLLSPFQRLVELKC